jgi:hypothetical protein
MIRRNFQTYGAEGLLDRLELGLKGIAGQVIQLPRRSVDRPDRDRLARRFEEFKKAA